VRAEQTTALRLDIQTHRRRTVPDNETTCNPLDVVPDEMPFDMPYGAPITLDRALVVIGAAVDMAKKRNWKMNVAVADSGGNLVVFQRNGRRDARRNPDRRAQGAGRRHVPTTH
jgi:hypothetical protein